MVHLRSVGEGHCMGCRRGSWRSWWGPLVSVSDGSRLSCTDSVGKGLLLVVGSSHFGCQKAFQTIV